MNRHTCSLCGSLALALLAALAGCSSTGHSHDKSHANSAPAPAPEMQLPPGWTEADMQACGIAATPGEMHKHLAHGVGKWRGKGATWIYPGSESFTSESTNTGKLILDGRFLQVEMKGDMPGMGPYNGLGLYGYDNVLQKFQSTWIDNFGTTMAIGTGDLSADGKVLTWTYTYSCPITKKPTTLREVDTITGPNTKTLEMYTIDPKSGKEWKMMVVELTRK